MSEHAPMIALLSGSIVATAVFTYMHHTQKKPRLRTDNGNSKRNDDTQAIEARRDSNVETMRMMVDNVIIFIDKNPGETYEAWIKHFHPENVHDDGSIDDRLLLKSSAYWILWKQLQGMKEYDSDAWQDLVSDVTVASRKKLDNWLMDSREGSFFLRDNVSYKSDHRIRLLFYVNGYGRAVITPLDEQLITYELGEIAPEYAKILEKECRGAGTGNYSSQVTGTDAHI